jgi:hypothetical protein
MPAPRGSTKAATNLITDSPGSATVTYEVRHTQLDPLTWLADPLVDVVETTADHVEHAERRLGSPTERKDADDRVALTIPVPTGRVPAPGSTSSVPACGSWCRRTS